MRNSKSISLGALAVMACALAIQLQASPLLQSDLTTWANATNPGYSVVDFQGIAGSPFGFVGSPYGSGGLTFTSNDNYLFGANGSTGWDLGSGDYLLGKNYVGVSGFASSTTSFSIDLSVYSLPGSDAVTVNTSSGSYNYTVYTPGNNASAFFGFTLGAGETLNSVVFTTQNFGQGAGGNAVIDNVRTGVAGGSVPDGGSTAFLLGVAGMGLWMMRKRRIA